MSGEHQGILGKEGSGWLKQRVKKGGKGQSEKIRFYTLDLANVEKAKDALFAFKKKNSARRLQKIHGLGDDIRKTPFLVRRGDALYCESQFPDINNVDDYPEVEIEEKEQKGSKPVREVEEDESLHEEYRLASVGKLPKNRSFKNEKAFNEYRDEFRAKYQKNPFNPLLTESGRVKWESRDPVSANDVYQVVLHTKKHDRSLHINTGTHGNEWGQTVVQDGGLAEAKFSKQDLYAVWNEDKVSVHIMSKYAGALTTKQYPAIDIIDAWCFSELSQRVVERESRISDEPLAHRLDQMLKQISQLPQEPISPSNLPALQAELSRKFFIRRPL